MADKTPTVVEMPPLEDVFVNVLKNVQNAVNTNQHKGAVDIELTFNQVTINSKGFPLLSSSKSESAIQLRLATRVLPQDASK